VERDSQFNLTAALLTAQNDTLVDEEGPPSPDGIDGNGTELALTDGHPTRITNMREVGDQTANYWTRNSGENGRPPIPGRAPSGLDQRADQDVREGHGG
jgi:hypothetical protein